MATASILCLPRRRRIQRALVLAVCVGLCAFAAGPALAQAPKPEPAPATPGSGLGPDPAPSARTTATSSASSSSASSYPSASSSSSVLRRSAPPQTAPSTQPGTISSGRPPAASHSTSPARQPTLKRERPRTTHRTSHPGRSRRVGRVWHFNALPTSLFRNASIRAIGAQALPRSGSVDSTFLLAGGLALVVLVVGETAFLLLAGSRIGARPGGRPGRAYLPAGPAREIELGR